MIAVGATVEAAKDRLQGVWLGIASSARLPNMQDYKSLYRNTVHAKYLLMAPSLDRAGTIGFRCVADRV